MILRGIDFGKVWGASGVQGFFGEGYRFHRLLGPLGPKFDGMTFVTKTTTLHPRVGNMELDPSTYQPKRLFPDCVIVKFWSQAVLNSVGLSGPGASRLLALQQWQKRTAPFFISFMPVGSDRGTREQEVQAFVALLGAYHLHEFEAPFGIQYNISCPNTGTGHKELIWEAERNLSYFSNFGRPVPVVVKINHLMPHDVMLRISEHHNCDALVVTNSIPWTEIDLETRMRVFGRVNSPLWARNFKYGDGGWSGPELFEPTLRWIEKVRQIGLKKPINGGGGINSVRRARNMMEAVGDNGSIAIGSVAITRPWRVRGIIRELS